MRAIILADASFASRERAMLSRLELGLADEGVRIIHALPEVSARWHQGEVFSQPLLYKDEGLPLSLNWRVHQLVTELEAVVGPVGRVADVVHAFGERCWDFGVALATETGASLALEVWSGALARSAVRVRYGADGTPATCMAPDPAIEHLLQREDSAVAVRLTPWGVHTPASQNEVLPEGRAWSALLVGSGRDPQALLAALEGLAAAAERFPDLMIFADADAVMKANLWPSVKRLGLLDRFTMIPDVEARRDPGLRCDILVYPEARGEHRSLLLEAMAAGMIVIAAPDPMVSVLSDGTSARLVDRRSPERWQSAILWALQNTGEARGLASAARALIKEHHRASSHIAAVMDAYEWLTAGATIPFSSS